MMPMVVMITIKKLYNYALKTLQTALTVEGAFFIAQIQTKSTRKLHHSYPLQYSYDHNIFPVALPLKFKHYKTHTQALISIIIIKARMVALPLKIKPLYS
jgi:hypothetical protein